jgi:hypothetical protein
LNASNKIANKRSCAHGGCAEAADAVCYRVTTSAIGSLIWTFAMELKQSRSMSFAEAATNVAVGLAFAFVVQIAIFPMFGIVVAITDNLMIAAIFTVVSLVRSFTLRRLFEAVRISGLVNRNRAGS